MKLAVTAVILTVLLCFRAISTQAQGDLTPPVLVDLQIEPAMVDTRNSAQTITFTTHITDDLSGLKNAWLLFSPLVQTAQRLDINFDEQDRASGDASDGMYVDTAILPQYAAEGRWLLDTAQFQDMVGNLYNSRAGYDDWPVRFDDYHFANIVDTTPTPTITPMPPIAPTPTIIPTPTAPVQGNDLALPVLVDLQIDPILVDTADSAQVITFTAHITDDLSGYAAGGVAFEPAISSDQRLYVSFYDEDRISGTPQDGIYVQASTLPQYAATGRWQMYFIQARDVVGNDGGTFLGASDWPDRFNDYHFANGADTTPAPMPKLYLPLIERLP